MMNDLLTTATMTPTLRCVPVIAKLAVMVTVKMKMVMVMLKTDMMMVKSTTHGLRYRRSHRKRSKSR